MRRAHRDHQPARNRGPVTVAATAAAVAGALLVGGCGSEQHVRGEVLPMVEADYAQAIRGSLAEIPGGRLAAAELRRPAGQEPVWETTVAAEDGAVRLVRMDATRGTLLSTEEVPGGRGAGQGGAALLDRAQLLPEEAARKVTEPDFGMVTAIDLRSSEGKAVWTVDVATIDPENVHAYDVDAATGDVLDRRSAGPRGE